ncbi:kinase-like protein [Venturia nashicola]|nr:kinase-like protein [Venturia nashicola]
MEPRSPRASRLEIPDDRQQKLRSIEIGHITQALKDCMKRSKKDHKCFIIYNDIKAIWTIQRISTVLWPDTPDLATVQYVQNNMIMMLSCLIWIRSTSWLHELLGRLWDEAKKQYLLVDDKIPVDKEKLLFLPDDAKDAFYKDQYIFKPLVIQLSSLQRTQSVSAEWRLPFESTEKNVGSGGYGVVDKVVIPPGYIKNEEGNGYDRPYVIACKKFRKNEDFIKEKENIEILKESFTQHGNILLHLGTIEHGTTENGLQQYILLPYADFGDLQEFLNGGVVHEKLRYDFKTRFSKVSMVDIPVPLLTQCVGIADALNWLHGNITLSSGNRDMSCVHMDLKPSNILIMRDERSVVGKWKISDFGISVWKNRSAPNDPEVISVGDYVRRGETINTRPKRHAGTYQAPEVKLFEPTQDQSRPLTENQKGIGRKSDVWSFGCIATEVLAFALGGAQLVQKFGQLRCGNNRENDFFYEQYRDRSSVTTTYLSPLPNPLPISAFQVRRSVVQWLNSLDKDGRSTHNWIQCFVGTIKKILIVDLYARPSSQEVLKLVEHVREHTSSSKAEAFIPCGILSQRSETHPAPHPPSRLPPQPEPSLGRHAYDVPDISGPKVSNTTLPQSTPVSPSFSSMGSFNENPLRHSDPKGKRPVSGMAWSDESFSIGQQIQSHAQHKNYDFFEERQAPHHQPHHIGGLPRFSKHDIIPEVAISDRIGTSTTPSRSGSGQAHKSQSTGTPSSTVGSRESQLSPARPKGSSQLNRNVSVFGYQPPDNLHGLLINSKTARTIRRKPEIQTITSSSKSFSTKATAIAVNLSKDSVFDVAYLVQNTVHLFHANILHRGISATREFSLPQSRGWCDIAIGGDFVAIWGHLPGTGKLIHVCDITAPSIRANVERKIDISLLTKVAVSQHGIAALLCHGTIYVVTIEDTPIVTPISGTKEQAFTDIAFNEDASLLFAWAFGSLRDSLYVWRCRKQQDKSSSAAHTKIIPYNSYEGCLVYPPSKHIFPAQTGGSLPQLGTLHNRTNQVLLPDMQKGLMYQNHSLITIEKQMWHRPLLKEYQIEYKPTHILQGKGEPISKLESKCDANSAVQIIPASAHDDDSVSIVIYNLDRTLEWVKLEAT